MEDVWRNRDASASLCEAGEAGETVAASRVRVGTRV
jgi:hypothetical protein